MPHDASPFTPGQPIRFEFFTGRKKEIDRLSSMIKSSVKGNLKIGFISGERGIGKRSLASMIYHISEVKYNVVGCHVLMGGVKDENQAIRRTIEELFNSNVKAPWYDSILNELGRKIRKVGAFGVSVELNLNDKELAELSTTFIDTIKELWSKIKDSRDGIILIWDDINALADSEDFANWLKSAVDTLAMYGNIPLCILFVGLEERRQDLIENQPSLARVFELIEIPTLTHDEVTQFYKQAFESGNATINDSELKKLVLFSGGLPVLVHEIGDAVWRTTNKSQISARNVNQGIIDAAVIIGRKLLGPQIYNAIQSEKYRSIFRKIMVIDKPNVPTKFKKSDIVQHLSEDETKVFHNFIRRMRKLEVIVSDPEIHGGYKFPNLLYAIYFHMEATIVHRRLVARHYPCRNNSFHK